MIWSYHEWNDEWEIFLLAIYSTIIGDYFHSLNARFGLFFSTFIAWHLSLSLWGFVESLPTPWTVSLLALPLFSFLCINSTSGRNVGALCSIQTTRFSRSVTILPLIIDISFGIRFVNEFPFIYSLFSLIYCLLSNTYNGKYAPLAQRNLHTTAEMVFLLYLNRNCLNSAFSFAIQTTAICSASSFEQSHKFHHSAVISWERQQN